MHLHILKNILTDKAGATSLPMSSSFLWYQSTMADTNHIADPPLPITTLGKQPVEACLYWKLELPFI
uniref:Uncharacterized protein n=1 Tax=Anguilla anguilla TaxID=7936 RepID=A0A0E9V0H2_ANGAN